MPDHPGLAHYIIHVYDVPPLAGVRIETTSGDLGPGGAGERRRGGTDVDLRRPPAAPERRGDREREHVVREAVSENALDVEGAVSDRQHDADRLMPAMERDRRDRARRVLAERLGGDRAQGVGADVVNGAVRERAQRHLPRAAAAPAQHRELLSGRRRQPAARRQGQRHLVTPVAQQRAGARIERLEERRQHLRREYLERCLLELEAHDALDQLHGRDGCAHAAQVSNRYARRSRANVAGSLSATGRRTFRWRECHGTWTSQTRRTTQITVSVRARASSDRRATERVRAFGCNATCHPA